jgi:hypothetical protein
LLEGLKKTHSLRLIKEQDNESVFRAATRHRPTDIMQRPRIGKRAQDCLTAYVTVNGVKALALFDSGSTTVSVSPEFVTVAKIATHPLKNPVTLQLGCVGSRSKINFGCNIEISFAKLVNEPIYADVVNIERYDMVIGTPFLHQFRCMLDFESNTIVVNNQRVDGLEGGDAPVEVKEAAKQNAKTHKTKATTGANKSK